MLEAGRAKLELIVRPGGSYTVRGIARAQEHVAMGAEAGEILAKKKAAEVAHAIATEPGEEACKSS